MAENAVLGSYRLEDQVGLYLRRAGQRHAAIFAEHMGDDLTPTQWAALVKLAELHSVSQNLLGRETAMDAATIKGVVDRLCKRGLLATAPRPRRRAADAGVDHAERGCARWSAAWPLQPPSPRKRCSRSIRGEQRMLLDLLRRIA